MEEEIEVLDQQLQSAREKLRERRMKTATNGPAEGAQPASHDLKDRLQYLPTTCNTSTAHGHSGNRPDNPAPPLSHKALARDSISSPNLSETLTDSGPSRMGDTTSPYSVQGIGNLQYYKELDGDVVVESQFLNKMDLAHLRHLAENEEEEDEAGSDSERNKYIGRVHYLIFKKTGVMEDLERALDRTKKQIPVRTDNPRFPSRLKDLIVMVVRKYQHTRALNDLQEAIFRAQEMVAATSLDNPERLARMADWIKLMFMKVSRTGLQEDFDEATTAVREVGLDTCIEKLDGGGFTLQITSPGYVYLFGYNMTYSDKTRAEEQLRHHANHAIDVLDTAAAVDVYTTAGMKLFAIESDMVSSLYDMDDEDLCSFAELHEGPTSDVQVELYICTCFFVFTRTGSMNHLKRAIQQAKRWVTVTPDDDQQHARCSEVFDMLSARMFLAENSQQAGVKGASLAMVKRVEIEDKTLDRVWDLEDLNRAIMVAKKIVAITPSDYSDRADNFDDLARLVYRRFEKMGNIADLDDAIKANSIAVEANSPISLKRASMLGSLGNKLTCRFEWIGEIQDLHRAFKVTRLALETFRSNYKSPPRILNNLARCFGARFEWMGKTSDINQAIEFVGEAVEAAPADDSDRTLFLLNLGRYLCRRFECSGAMNDIDRAIEVTHVAMDMTGPEDRDRHMIFNNIGVLLGRRFERTWLRKDLDRAIEFSDMAVKATPQDHPDQARGLGNLGVWLGKRYEDKKAIGDIDRSIEVTKAALELIPLQHLERASHFSNLGIWFYMRFKVHEEMQDLDQAIEAAERAVKITSIDQSRRGEWLNNLGNCLYERWKKTEVMGDLQRAISSFKDGWECHDAPPSIRISSGRQAGNLLASQLDYQASSALLRQCVELLPAVSPRSIRHTDKQEMLSRFDDMASDAAAAALNAGSDAYHALETPELGRGIIAGLLLDTRTDISTLEKQHVELAEEFSSLRDELDSPTDQALSSFSGESRLFQESRTKRRREAEDRFHEVTKEIRAQPGFENFLLPPTRAELEAAADLGPIVVVNMSSYRCDAFLIQRDSSEVLKLPALTQDMIHKWAEDLQSSRLKTSVHMWTMLERLWEVLGRPVLDTLGLCIPISNDEWPRVWWIPTGLLSQLPLHAAGRHTQGSTETVLDRVMSSYALSIKSLIHGRRQAPYSPSRPPSHRALLVAVSETPDLAGNRSLPFAKDEVEMLNDLCPSLQLKPIKLKPRREDVLRNLTACKLFHFAGHGHSDPKEPSQSHILLEDWKTDPLTVGDIRDLRLQENPPFLAFLSACLTGANEAGRLRDEGIHLVSAFQLAGFRHVVGTLWEVSDKYCVDVARVLYETMRDKGMTDLAVCEGLHRAIRALRDVNTDREGKGRTATLLGFEAPTRDPRNFDWVPYILFGV